jgi:hypothetical protein
MKKLIGGDLAGTAVDELGSPTAPCPTIPDHASPCPTLPCQTEPCRASPCRTMPRHAKSDHAALGEAFRQVEAMA